MSDGIWVRCAWWEEPSASHPSAGRWFKFYNSQNPSGAGYKAFIIPKVSSCRNNVSYIRELLSFSSHESTLGLRSADDPYRLHEPRAIGERGIANLSFSYNAPHLYNKLPITIKLINYLNSFKSHLKAFLFSRAYDQSGLTVQEDYAL